MTRRPRWTAPSGLLLSIILILSLLAAQAVRAAPFASIVMDARTGEVLQAENAETRLHPASLTKMMTLYIAFTAIQRGEISLDTEVTVAAEAAAMPPSKLGLRTGQTIRMRYLIRSAAVKSANDSATQIGIAISGSQEAFAQRMNAVAQAMGMRNTTFVNMNGLTAEGHLSTAHDMAILGRHVIYDFPQYYNLFSRTTADAGVAQVYNTNRRLLNGYEGADGIKTGYTNAAGYNLVASAQRGQVRIITAVFGATSNNDRYRRITDLLDLGFSRAPSSATVNRPDSVYVSSTATGAPGSAARTIRVSGLIQSSPRPPSRPGATRVASSGASGVEAALAAAMVVSAEAEPAPPPEERPAVAAAIATASDIAPAAAELPPVRPAEIIMTAADIAPVDSRDTQAVPEVVTRLSTSGGGMWGINVGRFTTRDRAERALIQVVLNEASALEGGIRRVDQRSGGFDAQVMGLSNDAADLACRRLQARGSMCFMIGPS
ncbi:D-alanyl-D-alanine carboxypeptidase family protein [Pseudoroseicyclus aestuarii]|nr:D-alanyl-D-alanine carboxypeptidase family protein [Pseudoroseicyclus aestuarii]